MLYVTPKNHYVQEVCARLVIQKIGTNEIQKDVELRVQPTRDEIREEGRIRDASEKRKQLSR